MDLYVDYSGKMPVPSQRVPYLATAPKDVGYPKADEFQDYLDSQTKRDYLKFGR